jgi:ketosteroid isomerase-like protein
MPDEQPLVLSTSRPLIRGLAVRTRHGVEGVPIWIRCEPRRALQRAEVRQSFLASWRGKGSGNLVRARENLLDSFEEWSIEPERVFDLGERLLVFVVFRAKGKGSGVAVDAEMAYLFTLREGKIIEWGLFGDRSKALEAAGLSE